MSNKFQIGNRVRVITNEDTDHHGDTGIISKVFDVTVHPYEVSFKYGDTIAEEFDADELELVTAAQPAPMVRDTQLRNDLFGRVQDTLEITLSYLPGELKEFPEKVQGVVNDFKNYCNLAEKQIQERDAEIERLRAALEKSHEALVGFQDVFDERAQQRDEEMTAIINDILNELGSPDNLSMGLGVHNLNVILGTIRRAKADAVKGDGE